LTFTFLGLLGRIFLLAYIYGGPTALPIGFFTIFWMAAVFGIMTSLALIFSYQPQHKKKLIGSSTNSTGKSTKMGTAQAPSHSVEV
jgi:membrane associated rhomboid family serine protease